MMNRNLYVIISLILCLCLLASCTAAKPALNGSGAPQADGSDKPGDKAGQQNGDGEAVQPSGDGDAGNGDNLPNTDGDGGHSEADINAVDKIRQVLRKDGTPVVNDELIEAFFNYYNEGNGNGPYHWQELRTLPVFGDGTEMDFDGLVLFVFMLYSHDINAEGYSYMHKETLEKTVDRVFSDLKYTHRRTSLFDFDDGIYTATGWDYHGGDYYRLREISRYSDGTFSASFDGFSFYELDFTEPYENVSENMKALFDYAGEITPETDERDLILEIFLRDDYAEIMHVTQHVDITFQLSDDPDFAFKYLSCKRERIGLP